VPRPREREGEAEAEAGAVGRDTGVGGRTGTEGQGLPEPGPLT